MKRMQISKQRQQILYFAILGKENSSVLIFCLPSFGEGQALKSCQKRKCLLSILRLVESIGIDFGTTLCASVVRKIC